MDTEEKAVITPVAAPEAVKVSPAAEIDFEAEYAALLKENDRIASDRDNYRKGLLKAKGKVKEDVYEDDTEPSEMEEIIERKIQEKFLDTQAAQSQKRLEEMTVKMARENKELKLALANKSQISNTSQGASDTSIEVKETFFTANQLEYFKKRGLDPEKVKQNMLKKR